MKAMILAAGFGKRMLPLTAQCPKPLLTINGKPLIAYHIERLVAAGVRDIVVNVGHLGHMLIDYLGNGDQFGVRITCSVEPPEAPLETAGGIIKALPLLGSQPFIVVNGDIWMEYSFASLLKRTTSSLFHGVVIPPPAHHPKGDFFLNQQGKLTMDNGERVVFAGVSLIAPELFSLMVDVAPEKLRSWICAAMTIGEASAELFSGEWVDVGTPQRLAELDQRISRLSLDRVRSECVPRSAE